MGGNRRIKHRCQNFSGPCGTSAYCKQQLQHGEKFGTCALSVSAACFTSLSSKDGKNRNRLRLLSTTNAKLEEKCQHLLIEGAGVLCVPLNSSTLTIDLAATLNLPIVLVTSGKLGSINHTILSLDYCTQRNLDLRAVIYNAYPNSSDVITKDTRMLLNHRVAHQHPKTIWLDMEIGATDLALDDIQTARLLR